MKVLRAIKVIAFVVAFLCLLASCAGNFFILKDACDSKTTAQEVHEKLNDTTFDFGSLFKGKAETFGDDWSNSTDDMLDSLLNDDEFIGLVMQYVDASGNIDTDGLATALSQQLGIDAQELKQLLDEGLNQAGNVEAGEEPTINVPGETPVAAGYQADKHIGALNELMTLANKRIEFGFMKDKTFKLCDSTEVGMYGEEVTTGEGEEAVTKIEPRFEVNLLLCIGIGVLTLAFILHIISKNCRKTFWGIILMLFGYILFLACFALGQILANIDFAKLIKPEITDIAAYRIYVVAGCTFLGALLGFGYLRCGSRAMKRRKKKNIARR